MLIINCNNWICWIIRAIQVAQIRKKTMPINARMMFVKLKFFDRNKKWYIFLAPICLGTKVSRIRNSMLLSADRRNERDNFISFSLWDDTSNSREYIYRRFFWMGRTMICWFYTLMDQTFDKLKYILYRIVWFGTICK